MIQVALVSCFLLTVPVGSVYLDHAGTTLYPRSLIEEFSKDMISSLLGNPHSASISSQLSSRRIERVRMQVLQFLNANADDFDVLFVANATAGIKLVMDSFGSHDGGFWYGYHKDAHTSLVGVREAAMAGQHCFESDQEVESWLAGQDMAEVKGDAELGLFAYPAQSNMNGRRLPPDWPGKLRQSSCKTNRHLYTLLDAAALVSTSSLDLSDTAQAPDFTVLSFYKIFGFPDLGALVVRKEAGSVLKHRKYFGGGTVEMVTCLKEQWHIRKEKDLHEQLEDGTLPVHSIIALDSAFSVHRRLFGSLEQVSSHTAFLAKRLHDGLIALRHDNGSLVCDLYTDSASSFEDSRTQGPVIAFNLRDKHGDWVSNAEVEKLAAIKNIHLRSGGLCNPGGIGSTLNLEPWELKRNFSAGQRCGNESDIIGGKPTGIIRVSLGAMSTLRDVTTFLEFLSEFFVNDERSALPTSLGMPLATVFHIESLMIYPIKSCGGWKIPSEMSWDIKPEGLVWDREWCLIHQGSRVALSQKRCPKMALLKPSIDLVEGFLRVRYNGPIPPSIPAEIAIPLSEDPSLFYNPTDNTISNTSRVCGDTINSKTYVSSTINNFFSEILGVPCSLARFPASGSGPSTRHAKAHLQPYQRRSHCKKQMPGSFPASQVLPSPDPPPILLSNESPILTVSRSSLNRLNEAIKQSGGKAASAEAFRANVVIAEDPSLSPGIEQPYVEDTWRYMMTIGGSHPNDSSQGVGLKKATYFEMLGSCRRCQMVCVDQSTAEKNEEPFVTLAKTRRFDGKVFFGQHMALARGQGGGGEKKIRAGDTVVGVRMGEEVEEMQKLMECKY